MCSNFRFYYKATNRCNSRALFFILAVVFVHKFSEHSFIVYRHIWIAIAVDGQEITISVNHKWFWLSTKIPTNNCKCSVCRYKFPSINKLRFSKCVYIFVCVNRFITLTPFTAHFHTLNPSLFCYGVNVFLWCTSFISKVSFEI